MSAANRIEDIAARWILRREEPGWTPSDEAALDAWLDESMAHKAAYWRLEHGWAAADRIASLGESAPPGLRGSSRRPMRWLPTAIAASIVLVLGIVVSAFVDLRRGTGPTAPVQTIATNVGGRTVVPLDDGSRIELNTATVVRASVTPTSRVVWLDRGEAYFEVRHSDRVPFLVHAGTRDVTVLGTRFIVRRDGDKVSVSVVEGRVRVDEVAPSGKPGSSTTVVTGTIAIGEGGSTLIAAKAPEKVEAALAWRDGRLSFDQSSLAEVAAEFNRYNAKKLVIGDREAAQIRIGGTFQASNVDAFVRLLRDAYGLKVQEEGQQIKITN